MLLANATLYRYPDKKLGVNQFLLRCHIKFFFWTINLNVEKQGKIPSSPCLIVSNHLSYLDILLFMSMTRSVFVSKAEVAKWPIFGAFTTNAGTVYINRESKQGIRDAQVQIRNILDKEQTVVFFPEGTSTGGDAVLPFKPSLFDSIRNTDYPLHSASIAYFVDSKTGSASENVCYWKDHIFFIHVFGLLGLKSIKAKLTFGPRITQSNDRKETAQAARAAVLSIFEKST